MDWLAIAACCGTIVLKCIGGCIMDAVKETDVYKSTKRKFRKLCCGCIYSSPADESEDELPIAARTGTVEIQGDTTQALIESPPKESKEEELPIESEMLNITTEALIESLPEESEEEEEEEPTAARTMTVEMLSNTTQALIESPPEESEESEEDELSTPARTMTVEIQSNTTPAMIEILPSGGIKVFMSPVYVTRVGEVRPVYPTEQLLKKIRQTNSSSNDPLMAAAEEFESSEEE